MNDDTNDNPEIRADAAEDHERRAKEIEETVRAADAKKRADEATAGEQLDKWLKNLDSVVSKLDACMSKMDSMSSRMDELEGKDKKNDNGDGNGDTNKNGDDEDQKARGRGPGEARLPVADDAQRQY
jgi:hypothetical protein